MNYLARICLGALPSPLILPFPTFFSLQFPFDLRLFFFFPESCASPPKRLLFSTAPVSIAPGTFCRVLLAALEKSFVKPILSQKLQPRKLIQFNTLCFSLLKKKKNPQLGKKPGKTPLFHTNLYLLHTDRLEIMLVEQNMVES